MNPDPRLENSDELICFDADIHGNPVRIEVDRETIEDHQRADTTTPEERLDFVNRNHDQIVAAVASYLREAPDVTGIRLGNEQLKHCR